MGRSESRTAVVMRKRYWREADARAVLADLEASRLSVAAFCQKHGLKPERVKWWRKGLKEGVAEPAAPAAVELLPVRVVQRQDDGVDDVGGGVEVVLRNGRRLAVRHGFDDVLLAEVARVVESWPC